MLLQRTQTLSEERGQQLRDQCPPVGGYPQRHGHDASQADHQGRETQEKGKNLLVTTIQGAPVSKLWGVTRFRRSIWSHFYVILFLFSRVPSSLQIGLMRVRWLIPPLLRHQCPRVKK